jgi:hypothetical protein
VSTLREYLSKNLSSIVARSKLGLKMRPLVHSVLLPELGDRELSELTSEAVAAWGQKRLAEPKKDGTPRSSASVDEELEALEQILSHARSGKVAGAPPAPPHGGGSGGAIHGAASGIRTKTKRGTQRGR